MPTEELISEQLRVLLVEDNPDDASLLERHLRRGGYSLAMDRVETGPEMLRALQAPQAPDIVIADYHLPNFSGPAALHLLKSSGLDIPFIMMSGAVSEETAVDSMRAGAQDYVTKQRLARLIPVIEREMREASARRSKAAAELAAELAERELRRSREDFNIGMGAAGLGMWSYDPRTGVITPDERMHRIFGSPKSSGVPSYWLDQLHPEDRERVEVHFAGFLAGDHDYDIEYRILRDGEVRWLLSRGKAVGPKEYPDRLVAILEDITERKNTAAALQQNEKLAAVGRLAASIAHEINNPLESITNLLYLMRSSADLSEVKDYLDTAELQLRRVSLITNQTLRFHRQSTRPAQVFCQDLIGDSLAMFQGRVNNNNITVEERQHAEHSVQCLEGEIRQVLNNLIGNAIDAMPIGGRLLLRSREGHNHRTGKRGLVITVADTGFGMIPEVRKKAFEAFYTTKGIGGTGLGLWISYEIVHRHRGDLRFRSCTTPGKSGTVFTLFLPFEN